MELIKRIDGRKNKYGRPIGLFRCGKCGGEVERRLDTGSVSKSCGCYQWRTGKKKDGSSASSKHRHSSGGRTKLYRSWEAMKSRCYRKKDNRYKHYGGRGIVVCDEWRFSFVEFMKWSMKSGYIDGLTIDRKDNDGNYEPSNCRFVTLTQNNRKRGGVKMSWAKVDAMRDFRSMYDYSIYRLSKIFGVSWDTASNIVKNKTWKTIK